MVYSLKVDLLQCILPFYLQQMTKQSLPIWLCSLPYRQRRREDVLYFSRLSPGTKTKNGCNTIKIHQKWNTKICAIVKDKKSIKNLVVKTKIWRGREILSKGVWGLINTCCTVVSNKIHLPLPITWLFDYLRNMTTYFLCIPQRIYSSCTTLL